MIWLNRLTVFRGYFETLAIENIFFFKKKVVNTNYNRVHKNEVSQSAPIAANLVINKLHSMARIWILYYTLYQITIANTSTAGMDCSQ